jgi:hypothetical protein
MKGAAAVFVKTSGFSPLKTRLAASVGEPEAHEFYRLACRSLAEQLSSTAQLEQAYWAVAEPIPDVENHWGDFPLLAQGSGGLGQRLATVYTELLSRHDYAILLGADTPQLTSQHLLETHRRLREVDVVIGPATDGGFYLFASRQPLRPELWEAVPYSQDDTCQRLVAELGSGTRVHWLPPLSDVDVVEDLPKMCRDLTEVRPLSPAQSQLLEWADRILTLSAAGHSQQS